MFYSPTPADLFVGAEQSRAGRLWRRAPLTRHKLQRA